MADRTPSAAYTLRRDIGLFPAGTPAEIIHEHPNGAVGVLVNGNAFTVWKDDLAPARSAATPSQRRRCHYCGKLVSVRLDGRFRKHGRLMRRETCIGTGKKPINA